MLDDPTDAIRFAFGLGMGLGVFITCLIRTLFFRRDDE